jgi:hypothetical protein
VVRVGHFEKFLEMVLRLSPLALEVVLGDSDILLSRVASFLVIAIIMGHNSDVPGAPIMPFFLPLAPFLALLMVALDGAARLPLTVAFTLPRTKAAPTASLQEACRVVISSSSLVVFG